MKYKCPCCEFYTFREPPDGNYSICPVCFWEDDPSAYDDPDEVCCCNRVSLHQAKRNYQTFGACSEDVRSCVRAPLADETSGVDDRFSV